MAAVDCSDRIGDLPDNVLHHVLSFLPIKDVIRTSFISRRWRYLWTSVPTLNFDGLVFSPKTNFVNFVDSVLSRRDYNCAMQKFYLRFSSYYCTGDRVHAWVHAAISHAVRELVLLSLTNMVFELPDDIFTCKSLMVLTLSLDHSTLSFPSSLHLPLLKTLKLAYVTFADENVNRLFSNCPVLENVLIKDSELSDSMIFHVSSTSVQRLTIDCVPEEFSFHTRSLGREVRVCMPKLVLFEYMDCSPQKVSLGKLSSLANAFIHIRPSLSDSESKGRRCFTNVINLLGSLATAEVLKLSFSSKLLSVICSPSLSCLPIFSKLKHLKLSIQVDRDGICLLTYFLDISPSLERLSLEISHGFQLFKTNNALNPQDSGCEVDEFKIVNIRGLMADPEIHHLKIINIRGFIGKTREVVLVKYLLKHACNLERITIVSSNNFSVNLKQMMKIEEDILMHPRGSMSSEIVFKSSH